MSENRYGTTSNFASCPAATGESKCPHFPDGAHRCGRPRDHMATDLRPTSEKTHLCTCGATWSSLMGSVDALIQISVDTAIQSVKAAAERLRGKVPDNRDHGVARTGWPENGCPRIGCEKFHSGIPHTHHKGDYTADQDDVNTRPAGADQ